MKKENTSLQRSDMLPYEKFKTFGPENLTDAELLAIIIRTGTAKEKPVELALRILDNPKSYRNGLLSLMHLSLQDLMDIPGIGEVKAIKLKSIAEISRRIARKKHSSLDFRMPSQIADYFMEDMRHLETEHSLLLALDAKGGLLGKVILSKGSVNSCQIVPRDVFLQALKLQAVEIVLLHNHPSGDPTPSKQDLEMTLRLKALGELLGIRLCDHIIIGELKYYSFCESGELGN